MRFLLFTVILLGFFTGCATQSPQVVSEKVKPHNSNKGQKNSSHKPEKKKGKTAIWELLSNDKVSLQFKNVDNGNYLTAIIDEGISEREVVPGHWELTGFEVNGRSYVSMNTSKKFVFRMSEGNNVYAGTIVIGCPQVSADQNKHLMKMKFFNRYPFSSSSGLCEMIIGNDFNGVQSKVKKTKNSKKLNLILGF